MSDRTGIQKRFRSLESSETFEGYSKVIVNVSDDVRYTAGTDVGRTLEITSPFGSQRVANDILARIRGYQYQPFSASGAILDPAAELGDGISADGLYSGIFSKKVSFGSLYSADVSAPGGEKINYKYPYKSKQERTIERNYRNLTTELKVQAGLISAEVTDRKNDIASVYSAIKVESGRITTEVNDRKNDVSSLYAAIHVQADRISLEATDRQNAINSVYASLQVQSSRIDAKVGKTGGNGSSFGWSLLDDSWTVYAGNSPVLRVTKSGAEVTGKITATSGKIGGFDITSNALSYNSMKWGGSNTYGIYLGPSGLQLGKNFKVDSAGNLYAASGTFTGNVYAANIKYGGSAGYLSGSGISDGSISGGKIGHNTITTSNTAGGINTSLGYADYANSVFSGYATADNLNAKSGTFGGNTYAGNVQYGGDYGTFNGSGITSRSIGGGRIAYNTITTGNTSSGINTSLGYADYAKSVFDGFVTAEYLKVNHFYHGDYMFGTQTINYIDHNGAKQSVVLLTGRR